MATGCSYNCTELPDHQRIECNEYFKGGILAIGVLDCDHEITDFTDQAELQNEIDLGRLKIIKGVKGIFPPTEPQEGESPTACGAQTILDGFNNTLTFKDFNVSAANNDFYEKLNARQTEVIWFECQEVDGVNYLKHVVQTATWTALAPQVDELNTVKQFFDVKAVWSSNTDEFPALFQAPPGIFT